MGWIHSVGMWIARVFSPNVGRKILAGVVAVEKYVPVIYEWAELAAEIAPQRTREQIEKLADTFGIPEIVAEYGKVDAGKLIAEILFMAAKARWPMVPDRAIRRAIELAYGAIRP